MKVIFHGDDFGITPGVNHGVIEAYRNGLLTSASIMAVGEAVEEAMDLALENPGLDVGIHLVLADERPLLKPKDLSALVSQGGMLPSMNRILKGIVSRTLDYDQVEREWCAQVEKVLKRGITISHLDSHQFIHLLPLLLSVCCQISRRYNIPFIRSSMIEPLIFRRSNTLGIGRLIQWTALWGWTRFIALRKRLHANTPIPSVGFLNTGGRLDYATVLAILNKLAKDQSCACVEFILHPGLGDNHTHEKYKHWHYFWENDLALMLNNDLRKGLEMRHIKTTSFREER